MPEECGTTTFVIAEPFDRAVKLIRVALTGSDFRVTGELNLSQRIQKRLLIRTPPCLVLFAAPGESPVNAGELSVTPVHVVISDRGAHTEVHLLKAPLTPEAEAGAVHLPTRFQSNLSRALGTIGMRCALGA